MSVKNIGSSDAQVLEFKIEQAEAKVAKTREVHEKAVNELSHGLMFLLTSGMIELLTDVKRIEL